VTANKPRRVDNLIRGELTDGEVVISIGGGERALILNAMGDAVLELCDGSRTAADIAALMRDVLAVPKDVDVTRDVSVLIDELLRAGVVE
jgi:coenzyme PQQ synthesis protein D (PqqD)